MTDHYTEIMRDVRRYTLAVILATLTGTGVVFGITFAILLMAGKL